MARVTAPPECPLCESQQKGGAMDEDGKFTGPCLRVFYECGAKASYREVRPAEGDEDQPPISRFEILVSGCGGKKKKRRRKEATA